MTKNTKANMSNIGGRLCKICLMNLRTPPQKWLSIRKIGLKDLVMRKWFLLLAKTTKASMIMMKSVKTLIAVLLCSMKVRQPIQRVFSATWTLIKTSAHNSMQLWTWTGTWSSWNRNKSSVKEYVLYLAYIGRLGSLPQDMVLLQVPNSKG